MQFESICKFNYNRSSDLICLNFILEAENALAKPVRSQRHAIHILTEAGKLKDLSPKLQEAAALREANPELPLSQLAALCHPPVTKSSLSHRLRKLIELSKKVEAEEETEESF